MHVRHVRTQFTALATLVVMLLVPAVVPSTVRAATIAVNTTADQFGEGPACALREAIQAANTDTAFGGCAKGSGTDTITVPAGTYTLTRVGANEDANATGDLDITSSLTLTGAGATTTMLDGNKQDRVVHIIPREQVTLTKLTLQHGQARNGGGVYTNGDTVTLIDSTVRANVVTGDGGGIFIFTGTVTLQGSTVTGNAAETVGSGMGGGIATQGRLTVSQSTVSGNKAWNGGGIDQRGSGGTTTVEYSMVSGNTAAHRGGGISLYNYGRLTLQHSTVRDNTAQDAGGGVASTYYTTLTVEHSTVSGNTVVEDRSGGDGGGQSASTRQRRHHLPSHRSARRGPPAGRHNDGQARCDIGAVERERAIIARDSFGRTVTNGWGSAAVGGPYNTHGRRDELQCGERHRHTPLTHGRQRHLCALAPSPSPQR